MGFFKFKKKETADLPDLSSLDSLPKDDLDKDLFGGSPPIGVLDHKEDRRDDMMMDLDMPPPPPGTAQPPPVQVAEEPQQTFDFTLPEMPKEQPVEQVA